MIMKNFSAEHEFLDYLREYNPNSSNDSTLIICIEQSGLSQEVINSAMEVYSWDKGRIYPGYPYGNTIQNILTFWDDNKNKLSIDAKIKIFMYCVAYMKEFLYGIDDHEEFAVTDEMIAHLNSCLVKPITNEVAYYIQHRALINRGQYVEPISTNSLIKLFNVIVSNSDCPIEIYKNKHNDTFLNRSNNTKTLQWIIFEMVTKQIYANLFNKTVCI